LILNRQDKYVVHASRLEEYVGKLGWALGFGGRECNVCLVDDRQIKRLNSLYLGKRRATDVLSFPWDAERRRRRTRITSARPRYAGRIASECAAVEFKNFLGDIVISVEAAKRNARQERHSTLNEIRWLILHGFLHLLGYDHESDQGEMAKLELALRRRLGI
jgi:probable rRNA maturation factor